MTQNQLLETYQLIRLLPIPACQCDGYTCDDEPNYTCATCGRSVPACYGAADAMPDSCDDCWCAVCGEVA